jgi:hypothetical protein
MSDPLPTPGDLPWSLIEPICKEIDIYEGPEEFARTFARVPKPAGLLYATLFCEQEICNGGFNQFFWNSTGVLAPEAVEGFKAIGQNSIAGIIQEACSLFGDTFPRDRSLRQSKLQTIDRQLLKSLDKRFYGMINTENDGFATAADRYAAQVGR